jgi:Ni,Fe-hydrogenase III component G
MVERKEAGRAKRTGVRKERREAERKRKKAEEVEGVTEERRVQDRLTRVFGLRIKRIEVPRKRRIFLRVDRKYAKSVVAYLVDKYDMFHLSTISAVDLRDKFEVVYHLAKPGLLVSVCAEVPRDDPTIDTITDVIPGAVLYEREIHDLMGIVPKGHPDLRRLLLYEDWPDDVFPLRKDWKTPRELDSPDK